MIKIYEIVFVMFHLPPHGCEDWETKSEEAFWMCYIRARGAEGLFSSLVVFSLRLSVKTLGLVLGAASPDRSNLKKFCFH